MLVSWHADPDVSRYWDDETFTREEMLERLSRPDVDGNIVEVAAEPVGYLQVWFDEASDQCGMDMFLVPAARGRGYGPDAARAMARELLERFGRSRVTVDPYEANQRAVRGWLKAGFRPVGARPADEEHLHPWILMEIGAASFEDDA